MKRFVLLLAALLGLSACGTGTEPLSVIGDPGQQLPALNTQPYGPLGGAFTSTTPYFQFTNVLSAVSPPSTGFVVAADANSVTIVHSTHLATVIGNLTAVFARVGDYVASGSNLGQTSALRLTVYWDGTPVCPYSYLNSTSRTAIAIPGFPLCQ